MEIDVRSWDTEYFGHFHMDVVKRIGKLKGVSLLAEEGTLYA
jgi:hypothetical protein